ncbi:unnamed protein product [Urochloa decumbens]|uniref:RING-type E3 ubiquitin transferase n=1 Tax=Urochloa decumbens TaxID=240449 RepID=A0ABC9DNB4_9POAL
MPLKLTIILLFLLLPWCITCAVLKLAGVPWLTTGAVAAVLLVFVAVTALSMGPSPSQQQPVAESTADPPLEAAALGLGASAIASLPVYKYKEKRGGGGGGEECSVCLGEVKPKETVKQLPVCAHLFHEGCIDVWLRSHGTCPVCRTRVNAATVAAVPASVEVVVHTDQAN